MHKLATPLFLVLFLAALSFTDSSAQSSFSISGKVAIASPTAASIEKYADIPVGYHTGVVPVNIPLYNIKSGPLQIPVSLSYHASGLKVDEQASWVGAGWTLNAGGVITRTVMGAPDDRGLQSAYTKYGHFSNYGYNSYLYTVNGGICGPLNCPDTAMHYPADDDAIAAGIKDGQPDLYFFNFNGYSGKFYFSDDRTPILVPQQDFRIQVNYPSDTNNFYGIHGFTITTPDGVKYFFGKNTLNDGNIDAIEATTHTSARSSWTGQGVTSAWYLNKIVSADGLFQVVLSYQKEKYAYYTLSTFPKSNVQTVSGVFDWLYDYDIVKNFIEGIRLSKIIFDNGELNFTSGSSRTDMTGFYDKSWSDTQDPNDSSYLNAKTLGSISIQTKFLCKKYRFFYNYFYDSNSLNSLLCQNSFPGICGNIHSDAYRLRLDSIQEVACDTSIKNPPYKFTYFSGTVPRKLSFGIDHWGFHNGADNNSSLLPTYTTREGTEFYTVTGANRDAAWPAMRGGALEKITYPTGGFRQFEFEPHRTSVNFTRYDRTSRASLSGGYDGHNGFLGDGGSNPIAINLTFSGNTYEIIISNSSQGGDTRIQIFDGSSNIVFNEAASTGQSDTFFRALTAGTYQVVLTKNSASTGNGGQVSIYEWVPTSVLDSALVGGLRIKTIIQNDGITSTNIITNYSYNAGLSTGILYSRPVYLQTIRNDIYKIAGNNIYNSGSAYVCSTNGCIGCDGSLRLPYLISPSSIRPMATTQGAHIGYNEVKVSQANNGFSIYRYYGSNTWDNITDDVCTRYLNTGVCNSSDPGYPAQPLPFEFMRGELKYEGHYNQTGQILSEQAYFPAFKPDSILTPGLIVENIARIALPDRGFTYSTYEDGSHNISAFLITTQGPLTVRYIYAKLATEYFLQSYKKIMDSVISSEFDPSEGTYLSKKVVTYYNSPYHTMPTREVTDNSKGQIIAANYKYASDFRISGCDSYSTGIHVYDSTYVADSLAFYGNVASCTDTTLNCRYQLYQLYRFKKSRNRIQYIQTRRANFTDSSNNYKNCLLTAKNSANADLKPILQLQEDFQNPAIEISRWKNNNLLGADFTRFDYVSNPPGKVFPLKWQTLKLSAPSPSFTNAVVSGNSLSKDSRYKDEAFARYSAGNVVDLLARDGVTYSYLWDYNNNFPIAKIAGAPDTLAAFTSFEAGGSGNWTIGSSQRDTINSLTGHKCYQLSNGNISKSGLDTLQEFTLSYWTKNSASFSITGTVGSVQNIKSVGDWKCFEHTIRNRSSVTISGTGLIDELRLYPSQAQMITYTYDPQVGITTECDIANRIIYYQYDALGRLKIIRDQDKNIIKSFDYKYQEQQ